MTFKDIKVHDISEKPDRAFIILTTDDCGIPSIHLCRFIPENYELVVRHHHAVGWFYSELEQNFTPNDGSLWLCEANNTEGEHVTLLAQYELDTDRWVINSVDLTFFYPYEALTPIKELNV